MAELPKYVQELNQIIDHISKQPDNTWKKTQKELAEELDLDQPVMSQRMKTLINQGKVKRGEPLPMRGRNFALVVVDPTPFEERITRNEADDRAYQPGEVPPAFEYAQIDKEMIADAIIQMIEHHERDRRTLQQQELAVDALKERLEEEHWRAQELSQDKEELERQLEEARNLAAKLNQRIISIVKERTPDGGHGGRMVDLDSLDKESEGVLRVLMSTND